MNASRTLPRRLPRPISGLLLLVALMLAFHASPVTAGRSWCRVDPVFNVGGRVGHVYVSSYEEMFTKATGPTKVTITIPDEATAALLYTDTGFGHGYTVRFATNDEWDVAYEGVEGGEEEDGDGGSDGAVDLDGDGFVTHFPVGIAVYVPASTSDLPVLVEFVASDGTVSSKEGMPNSWVTFTANL